jgi:hypothetical protein
MANAQPKPKPRRSRRSGIKKMKLVKANLEVLKKYLATLFISLFVVSCTTVKYVIVDPKDSTKLVEIRKRIMYDDYYTPALSPLYNNYWWWYNSRPIIIQRQPIIVPQRPQQPSAPIRGYRPGFGPLPPTPRPRR